MKRSIDEAIAEATERIIRGDFVRAILTGKRKSNTSAFTRIDLRPVEIKGEVLLQVISHDGKKDFTANHPFLQESIMEILSSGFSNIIIDSTDESFNIQITKKEEAITGVSRTKLERSLTHDHQKEYLLPENHHLFRVVGFADSLGRIKPNKRDKFIQINELLKIISSLIKELPQGVRYRVVDLASGSATLTLAVHIYLQERLDVETIGIERQEALVKKSLDFAQQLNLAKISFNQSEISGVKPEDIDLLLALHACDTATDDAISFAIKSQVGALLIVPCCHQTRPELAQEIPSEISFITRDGILKERYADIVTDSLRAEKLRASGYRTSVMEFVGDDHTARNLLIRGIKL
jgi:hypothetical protein